MLMFITNKTFILNSAMFFISQGFLHKFYIKLKFHLIITYSPFLMEGKSRNRDIIYGIC